MATDIKVYGCLDARTEEGKVAKAEQVYDEQLQRYQSDINKEVDGYDISLANATGSTLAEYADLAAALAVVPSTAQTGGMTVKFVNSTTHKYEQYRLTANAWSTSVGDWQGVDDKPTAGSNNFVKSGGVYNSTPTIANSPTESDLDFSDEQGNVLVRFAGGHLQVKNFSSADALESIQAILSNIGFDNVPEFDEEADYPVGEIVRYGKYVYVFTSAHTAGEWDDTEAEKTVLTSESQVEVMDDASEADLDIADEDNNVLARFTEGHIKTKNFDSSKDATEEERGLMSAIDKVKLNAINSINLSGIYSRSNPFGVNSSVVYKDAAKRTLPNNIVPLIIIAGQSNADGRAPYNTAGNWENTQWLAEANYSVENYYMWNVSKETFETYNVLTNNGADAGSGSDGSGEDKYSFDPFFAKKFIDTYNVPVYAVRETLGGIGIEDYVIRGGKKNTWQAKIGYIEHKYGVTDINYLLLRLLEKINKIQKWCQDNNKILFPVAILWHQGEHDASDTLRPYFKENTSEVISFIRGIFKAPALPFINGFVQNDYNENYAKVNQIFLELNEIDDYMKTVDMEGHYTSIGDGLHYDGQALAYMGEQMFNYYKQLNSLI